MKRLIFLSLLSLGGWFASDRIAWGADAAPLASRLPAATSTIDWNPATDHVVSAKDHPEAGYPRAKQLSNGEILLAYHYGDADGAFGETVTLRKSRDGGATWYQTQDVDTFEDGKFWGFSNPDFLELGSGRLLLVSAARGIAAPDAEDNANDDDFRSECEHSGLRLRFSRDFGATWGRPRMAAVGRGRIWEPSIVQRTDGTLEIYYAIEPVDLLASDGLGQRIERIASSDEGKTWSDPQLVSYTDDCRNGMPSALVLRNGNVACAQEVVDSPTSPWITTVFGDQHREQSLPQTRYGFGASPFLAHAPDGGTLLAFTSRERKTPPPEEVDSSWMFADIYVQGGNAKATNFGKASLPWKGLNAGTGAFYPCVMNKSDGSVVALATFVTLKSDHTTRTVIRWIEGKFNAAVP